MVVRVVESDVELDEALASDGTIVVYFTAVWCGPCRRVAPSFEGAASRHVDLKFVKVNVDDLNDVRNVTSVPTFRVYCGNRVREELVGADTDGLQAMIQRWSSW